MPVAISVFYQPCFLMQLLQHFLHIKDEGNT